MIADQYGRRRDPLRPEEPAPPKKPQPKPKRQPPAKPAAKKGKRK